MDNAHIWDSVLKTLDVTKMDKIIEREAYNRKNPAGFSISTVYPLVTQTAPNRWQVRVNIGRADNRPDVLYLGDDFEEAKRISDEYRSTRVRKSPKRHGIQGLSRGL